MSTHFCFPLFLRISLQIIVVGCEIILCGRSQMEILWVKSKEIILSGWSWMGVLLHNANGWMRLLVGGASLLKIPAHPVSPFQFNSIWFWINLKVLHISIFIDTSRCLAEDPSLSGLCFLIQFHSKYMLQFTIWNTSLAFNCSYCQSKELQDTAKFIHEKWRYICRIQLLLSKEYRSGPFTMHGETLPPPTGGLAQ